MPNVWNHIFTTVNTSATRKNGAVHTRSRHVSGRSHHTIPNNNIGKTATEPLLSIANVNAARLSQYQV